MDDIAIIDLFFLRDQQAISALDEKYGRLCRSLAQNILSDLRDSEECVSDAYLGVWNAVPPQRPDPLVSFLCRIVKNLSLKRLRTKSAAKRNSAYDLSLDELSGALSRGDEVTEAVEAKELAEMINRFLSALDEQKRVIFLRRYWFCDSVEDIARLVGKSSHYISVQLHRLRRSLRDCLAAEGVEV